VTLEQALEVAEEALLYTAQQITKTVGARWAQKERRALAVIQERRRRPPKEGGVMKSLAYILLVYALLMTAAGIVFHSIDSKFPMTRTVEVER